MGEWTLFPLPLFNFRQLAMLSERPFLQIEPLRPVFVV
jgi:hypothetical protein